ncbi:MAG TPA: response regulator, partial [Burkholderiales bacterium]|nr:response regulator [Burkholderiales bacterium]
MRILLVEDDELLGAGIEDALTRAHFSLEWVRTGPLAAAALARDGFDAAVLDLGLPGMDGLEVLSRARAAGNRTPVLILSARDAVA